MSDIEEEYTIDLPEALTVEDGAYLVTVNKMSLLEDKKGNRNVVIETEVSEGPFKGARVNDWIGQSKDLPFGIQQMNTAKLNSFMVACADGETDFDRKLTFRKNDEDVLVNTSVVGLEVGVYLTTNKGYLNVDRKGYFPPSELTEDEKPF
jgi:Protein of unknown function (DUF669)